MNFGKSLEDKVSELLQEINTILDSKQKVNTIIQRIEAFIVQYQHELTREQVERIRTKYKKIVYMIAANLRQIDAKIFAKLKNIDDTNVDAHSPFSHLLAINANTNLIWKIVNEILNTESIDQRVVIIERWIKIMLINFNDHNTLFAVLAALNMASIMRLTHTREGLSKGAIAVLEQAEKIMASSGGLIESRSPEQEIIPALCALKQKFTALKETENTEMLISYKRKILALQLAVQRKRKKIKACYVSYQELTAEGAVSDNLARREAFALSLQLEPREKKVQKPTIMKTVGSLLIKEQAKLPLNKKMRKILKDKEFEAEIQQFNMQILESNLKIRTIIENIQKYGEAQLDTSYGMNMRQLVNNISKRLCTLQQQIVETPSVPIRSINKLLMYLQTLPEEEPLVRQHSYGDFFKKMFNIDTELSCLINELKSQVKEQKNIINKKSDVLMRRHFQATIRIKSLLLPDQLASIEMSSASTYGDKTPRTPSRKSASPSQEELARLRHDANRLGLTLFCSALPSTLNRNEEVQVSLTKGRSYSS